MSTPSFSASFLTRPLAVTLKPITTASLALARSTSDSLMPPTPACTISTLTSSLPSLARLVVNTSTEPCTSPLSTTLSWGFSPARMRSWKSSRVIWRMAGPCFCLLSSVRFCAMPRAMRSSGTTTNCVPASGGPLKPVTTTGVAGPACSTFSRREFCSVRTRPQHSPARNTSPARSVPLWTKIQATGPIPRVISDSMTTPRAGLSGLAFRSSISASSSSISISSSTPSPFLAEMSFMMVLPPHASSTNSYCVNCWRIRSGWASGLSHLFTATTMGTSAALAWSIASTVCGITPSSAATTSTTMSVALAPRARIWVKASWPGVSRNTTRPSLTGTS